MNSIKLLVESIDNMYPHTPKGEVPQEKAPVVEQRVEQQPTPPSTPKQTHDDRNRNDPIQESLVPLEKKEKAPVDVACKDFKPDSVSAATTFFSVATILFIPNYLVIKPVLFTWLIITYPFTYTFEALGIIRKSAKVEYTYPAEPADYEAPIEEEASRPSKTDIIKEDIISNTIKSPTSSSKYIIPAPQRLFPLSRNPAKKKRKTLVLDLDETLIHSLARTSPRISTAQSKMIEIKINNISTLYYVYKRPFCDYFLKEIANWFDLQIFTASVQEYADPIIDWLESEISTSKTATAGVPFFSKRYYRNDCTYRKGVGYIKDLSRFFPREDLKNVVILDNSPVSYAMHEKNAVMIEGWINDTNDRDLLNLLPLLFSLSMTIDVRLILGLRYGERLFE